MGRNYLKTTVTGNRKETSHVLIYSEFPRVTFFLRLFSLSFFGQNNLQKNTLDI